MADGVGSENYSYDILGRVTQVQKLITPTTYTLSYGYNLASEPTSITYPSGRGVQPQYDMIGRTSTVTSGATNYASAFAYNPAQQVTDFSYSNGDTATFTYSADRLQLQTLTYKQGATNLFKLTYGYTQPNGGNNGQITQITDNVSAGRTVNYTYDSLNRLSTALTTGGATYPQWGLAWTYDRYGNRTAQTVTAGTAPSNSLTIDPATNRITNYTYDNNGNLTVEPLTPNNNYGYDSENQMVSFSGSGSGTYSYDGNGLRVKKVSGTTTTVYLFSGAKVLAEYVNGAAPSAPTKEYIYLGSQLLATIAGGVTTYHHPDHLSARISTNSSGAKVGDQGHYPFGESWYLTNTTTKWQFTSYERDSESGNDYAMARYHINRVGRFQSPDPLGGSTIDPQSLNRFAYVGNSPIDTVDPSGLLEITVCAAGNVNCFGPGAAWGDGGGAGGGGSDGPPICRLPNGEPCPTPDPEPEPEAQPDPSRFEICALYPFLCAVGGPPERGGPGRGRPAKEPANNKTKPKSPARQQCEANAANKYQNTFNAVDKGFYPKAGKSALKGGLWGAAAGCAFTFEIGCAEGGLPGYAIGALSGAGKSMWEDLGSVGMAYLQYRDEMNACKAIP